MIERKLSKAVAAPECDMGVGEGNRGKNKPWEIPKELGGGAAADDCGGAAVAESAPEHAGAEKGH